MRTAGNSRTHFWQTSGLGVEEVYILPPLLSHKHYYNNTINSLDCVISWVTLLNNKVHQQVTKRTIEKHKRIKLWENKSWKIVKPEIKHCYKSIGYFRPQRGLFTFSNFQNTRLCRMTHEFQTNNFRVYFLYGLVQNHFLSLSDPRFAERRDKEERRVGSRYLSGLIGGPT